jgi:hypothetical protein
MVCLLKPVASKAPKAVVLLVRGFTFVIAVIYPFECSRGSYYFENVICEGESHWHVST